MSLSAASRNSAGRRTAWLVALAGALVVVTMPARAHAASHAGTKTICKTVRRPGKRVRVCPTAKKPAVKKTCKKVVRHGKKSRVCTKATRKAAPRPGKPAAAAGLLRVWAQVIQTTANLSDALTAMPSEAFTSAPAAGATVITVNDAVHYQTMIGFGAAMTDSSAWLLEDELSASQRTQAFQDLFGAQGIRLDYLRIPMGASDYTVAGPYSYDDMPAGEADPTMAGFSIAHDVPYDIPAVQQALALNPRIYTLANPWSAPPWMKTNRVFNDQNLAGNVDPQYYPALAGYFVKFIQAYQSYGIPIDAITPMNEPNSDSGWPGTHLTPADDATFLPDDLVPALDAAGLHPTIWGDDDTELSDADALLSGPAAGDLGGVAVHCYQGMGQMSTLHAQYPAEPIIVNECSPGIIPDATAEVGIDAANNWASGVQLWNLALDTNGGPYEGSQSWGCPGCTGVLTVNDSTQTYSHSLNYYQFGQMSKYVLPGAVRIATSPRLVTDGYGISTGIDDVAFQNPDGSKVFVAYNNSSAANSFALDYDGKYLSDTLPAGATVTITWT